MCGSLYSTEIQMLKVKSITNITVKLQGGISNFMVPGPSTPAPIPFYNA